MNLRIGTGGFVAPKPRSPRRKFNNAPKKAPQKEKKIIPPSIPVVNRDDEVLKIFPDPSIFTILVPGRSRRGRANHGGSDVPVTTTGPGRSRRQAGKEAVDRHAINKPCVEAIIPDVLNESVHPTILDTIMEGVAQWPRLPNPLLVPLKGCPSSWPSHSEKDLCASIMLATYNQMVQSDRPTLLDKGVITGNCMAEALYLLRDTTKPARVIKTPSG